jgi:adenine phosphoribosyltransferase
MPYQPQDEAQGQNQLVDLANEQQVASYLRDKIRVFPNFPRPGLDFSDVTTLLLDPVAFQVAIDALKHRYVSKNITHVVSCESRGFIFGAPLALALQVAFVPVRRARRLPGNTIGVDYTSGFYTGRMEIHDDAIEKGSRVVIIDDLVASVRRYALRVAAGSFHTLRARNKLTVLALSVCA